MPREAYDRRLAILQRSTSGNSIEPPDSTDDAASPLLVLVWWEVVPPDADADLQALVDDGRGDRAADRPVLPMLELRELADRLRVVDGGATITLW